MRKELQEAVDFIKGLIAAKPRFGVILGTGLGSLAQEIENARVVDYQDIPHFPLSTVESHSGKLIFGRLSGKEVVAMQGRFHYYEGYSMQQVAFPVRVMRLLGVEKLFISNAAGGLNPDHRLSDLMIIQDHINLMPENPLRGANDADLGPRFPDMSEPYDAELINQALEIARSNNVRAHKGVYAAVPGPNLETKAEYKYLRMIGADAVGMSTAPENIVARHMGMPCFAISVITDLCTPETLKPVVLSEIFAAAARAEPGLTLILKELISRQV